MRVSCTLKAGTVVAVGPTQSVQCERKPDDECPKVPMTWPRTYSSSTHHQIYLNLFNRPESEIKKFLTKCHVTPWPDPE